MNICQTCGALGVIYPDHICANAPRSISLPTLARCHLCSTTCAEAELGGDLCNGRCVALDDASGAQPTDPEKEPRFQPGEET